MKIRICKHLDITMRSSNELRFGYLCPFKQVVREWQTTISIKNLVHHANKRSNLSVFLVLVCGFVVKDYPSALTCFQKVLETMTWFSFKFFFTNNFKTLSLMLMWLYIHNWGHIWWMVAYKTIPIVLKCKSSCLGMHASLNQGEISTHKWRENHMLKQLYDYL